jgi:hypothetical protein
MKGSVLPACIYWSQPAVAVATSSVFRGDAESIRRNLGLINATQRRTGMAKMAFPREKVII